MKLLDRTIALLILVPFAAVVIAAFLQMTMGYLVVIFLLIVIGRLVFYWTNPRW